MPPRRSSTRNSLPTPANSVTTGKPSASPTVSAPATVKREPRATRFNGGLRTPASLTDGEDDEFDNLMSDDETDPEELKQEDMGSRKKRKAPSETESTFSPFSTDRSLPSRRTSERYILESVTLPIRRSKLGTDKTGSIDNMTLGSPAVRTGSRSSLKAELEKTEVDEKDILSDNSNRPDGRPSKTAVKSTRLSKPVKPVTKPADQLFKIGHHSNVAKVDPASLALAEDDETARPTRGRGPATKGKGKAKPVQTAAKGRANNIVLSDEESEFSSDIKPESEDIKDEEADDDFAENSEEEEKQLRRAIQVSKTAAGSSRNGSGSSSRASTAGVGARKGRGKGKLAGQTLGGGVKIESKGNSRALRLAVLKAAERRRAIAKDEAANSSDSDSDSEFGITESDSDSDLSGLSDDDSGIPTPSGRRTTAIKEKVTRISRFSGRGQKLDGEEEFEDDGDELASEISGIDGAMGSEMTVDKAMGKEMTIALLKAKRRQARKEAEAFDKPRKEKEKALKRKLGRKLTQGEKNAIALSMHHPELEDVWGDLKANIVPVKPVPMEAHPSLKLTLLPFQKESLFWMKKQEEGPWKGGMLADEMGMGKTIQTIALLLSEPRRKPSLVVAPVVALMQWKHEIETHAEGFTVCLWHGTGRMKAEQLKKFDVVMVSYGTLEASFRRQQRGFKRGNLFIKEKSPMHEFEWYRVVLDEAHNIKERSTNAAKAAFALQAKYKWCLSGTPLQNRVGELYSLVRFLGADPFSYYFCKRCDCKSLHWQFTNKRNCDTCGCSPMQHVCLWNTEILTPIAKYGIVEGGPGQTAFKKLKILLDRMMLRRTKLERADDLGLPPRTIVVRRDFFSPQEKELYMSLFTNAKRTFNTYLDAGTVLNNYSNIFSLITRMRQMACHPDLVLRSKTSTYVKDINDEAVCRICNDAAEDAIVSACKHVFDRECIRQYLEVQQMRGHRPECPVCHIEISIDLEAEAIELDEGGKKARQGILSRLNLDNWRSSSKLEALVEELEKLRNQDCTIKSLVFSQFVSFLDLIAFRLQRAGFVICRLEGGMTPQQRDATIQHFMKNTHVTVFLISLKAGGVALNLTEASRVYMMDSWWNPSVEYQAMDRIHRLGQKRPVTVIKLVTEDSIEDQIVQLQQKKLAMTEAALSTDPDAALGKLTVEDLGFLFKL